MLGAIIGDVAGSLYEVKEVNALLNKEKISKEERCEILNEEIENFIGEYELVTNNYDKYNMNILAKEKLLITHDDITHYKKGMISLTTFNVIGKNKILAYFNGVAENIDESKQDEFNFQKICFELENGKLKQTECPSNIGDQYIDTDNKNFNIKYEKNQ
jgi:hypothetical protein